MLGTLDFLLVAMLRRRKVSVPECCIQTSVTSYMYLSRDGMLPLSANVTPVYKKGSKQHVVNYRPISLTCTVCKVILPILFIYLFFLVS